MHLRRCSFKSLTNGFGPTPGKLGVHVAASSHGKSDELSFFISMIRLMVLYFGQAWFLHTLLAQPSHFGVNSAILLVTSGAAWYVAAYLTLNVLQSSLNGILKVYFSYAPAAFCVFLTNS